MHENTNIQMNYTLNNRNKIISDRSKNYKNNKKNVDLLKTKLNF